MNKKPHGLRGKGKALAWLLAHQTYAGDDCLRWPFSTNRGYGMFGAYGGHYKAHRYMCELVSGPPPTPRHECSHECGNGHLSCVNPRHLRWKTPRQNQLDRRKHGTTNRSPNGRLTRLTPEQIAEIRALKGKVSQVKLAERFGLKRGGVEYWQRDNHPPSPPGSSVTAEWRRRNRANAV